LRTKEQGTHLTLNEHDDDDDDDETSITLYHLVLFELINWTTMLVNHTALLGQRIKENEVISYEKTLRHVLTFTGTQKRQQETYIHNYTVE